MDVVTTLYKHFFKCMFSLVYLDVIYNAVTKVDLLSHSGNPPNLGPYPDLGLCTRGTRTATAGVSD